MSHLSEKEVYAKTVYAEARGEIPEGQLWVAWVIKNRAGLDKSYWGGRTIKGVCLHQGQFECWNGVSDISIGEPAIYEKIKKLTDSVYAAPHSSDPTGGCDHYNNPSKEGKPAWTRNCNEIHKIGGHQFYKSKCL